MPRISLTDRSRVARISSQMAKLLRGQMRPSPPLLLLLLLSVMERNDELWKIFLWWVARRYNVESFVTVETLKYAADLTDKSCRFLSVENINFFLIWFRLNAGNNKVEQVWPTFPLPLFFFIRTRTCGGDRSLARNRTKWIRDQFFTRRKTMVC